MLRLNPTATIRIAETTLTRPAKGSVSFHDGRKSMVEVLLKMSLTVMTGLP